MSKRIRTAYNNVELNRLTGLLEKINPAIENVQSNSKEKDFIDEVAHENVELAIAEIKSKSSVLNAMCTNNEIDIKGAMYDVSNGKVTFIEK